MSHAQQAPRRARPWLVLWGSFWAAACGSPEITPDPFCAEGEACEAIEPPWEFQEDAEAADAEPSVDALVEEVLLGEPPLRDAGALEVTVVDARSDAVADSAPAVGAPPTCASIDQRLRADFGIVLRPGTLAFEGLATEDLNCADRIKVYEMFQLPFAYQGYRQRIAPADAFTIHLYRTSRPTAGSCSAYVPNAQAIQVRDLRQCLSVVSSRTDTDFLRIAMFLIHESGHVITARNPSLRTAFSNANLPQRDPRCYDRGFLKTYSLRTTNPVSESFAEAGALFLGHRKVGTMGTINNFQTECPNTYDWIRTNVFGNRR